MYGRWVGVRIRAKTHLFWAALAAKVLSTVRPGVPTVRADEWRWAEALRAALLPGTPGEHDGTRTPPEKHEASVPVLPEWPHTDFTFYRRFMTYSYGIFEKRFILNF